MFIGLKDLVNLRYKTYNYDMRKYNKIVSGFLIIVMLIAANISSFAQNIAYKPASSFTYDYFILGKTNEKDFIKKLKQDMYDNDVEKNKKPALFNTPRKQEIYIPSYTPNENKQVIDIEIYPRKTASAYNDFLYYNSYPEQSPYWKWTAFIPDDIASEDDVLLILHKHKQITDEIIELFKQNPKYKKEKNIKTAVMSGGLALLILEFMLVWEITIPGIPKWASFTTLLGLDIWLTDAVAYSLRTLEGIKEYLDDVDIQIAHFDNIEERNMLKSQIESATIDICKKAREEQERILQDYMDEVTDFYIPERSKEQNKYGMIVNFCDNNRGVEDKNYRLNIGQYLYEEYHKKDSSEQRIEYVRKEMLRIYYALLFIREELKDTSDRLRFERALIDIATAYKIATITITDGRIIKMFSEPKMLTQMDLALEKGLDTTDIIQKNEDGEDYTQLGLDLAQKSSAYRSYPSLLNRAQLNYIVQKIDIYNQKTEKAQQEKNARLMKQNSEMIENINKAIKN